MGASTGAGDVLDNSDCRRFCSSGELDPWWYCSSVGECTGGCSSGGEGSTGAWCEPKLLVRRGAFEKAVGEGSSRVGAATYCCPFPSVASVVRASAASNVVVGV